MVDAGVNHYGMEFGSASVALHGGLGGRGDGRGCTRADPGQGAGAGRLSWQPAPVRAGHFYIDVARAFLYHGDSRRALGALIRARRVAPQQARVHPMVRDAVRAIAHAEPRPSEELRSFAAWLGVDW
jgi:hypothetical protein